MTMKDNLDREQKLNLIYRHTHPDYKGSLEGGKSILICRGGTRLVALSDLTDKEIEDRIDYAIKKEVERLDAIEMKKPIRGLYCCCCGGHFHGRQWWNQDTGHGMGDCCADRVAAKMDDPDDFRQTYGVAGIHYNVI